MMQPPYPLVALKTLTEERRQTPGGGSVALGAVMAQGGAKKTIRQLRQERGWTQETLARRLGAGQTAVSAWERGERMPRQRSILRLADVFGVPVEAIAFGPAEQETQDGP